MPILLSVAVAAVLGATQAPESKQIKLASPGIAGVNLPKDRADFFADHLAQELNNRGVRVITAKEVNAVLGLARTQQLMGCDESSTTCMTELADALGVDGVITGSVGQFGPAYTANINIVSNGDGRLLGSVTVRADSEKQLLDGLAVEAQRAAAEVGNRLGKPVRRFVSQALDVDVLDILGGGFSISYARPLADQVSLFTKFFVTAGQQDPDLPGMAFSKMNIEAQAHYHVLDRAPFGLHFGGGLVIQSTNGFLNSGGVQAAFGGIGMGLSAEIGYGLVLFDFLHLGAALTGYLGVTSVAFASTNPVAFPPIDSYLPLYSGNIRTQVGFAF